MKSNEVFLQRKCCSTCTFYTMGKNSTVWPTMLIVISILILCYRSNCIFFHSSIVALQKSLLCLSFSLLWGWAASWYSRSTFPSPRSCDHVEIRINVSFLSNWDKVFNVQGSKKWRVICSRIVSGGSESTSRTSVRPWTGETWKQLDFIFENMWSYWTVCQSLTVNV